MDQQKRNSKSVGALDAWEELQAAKLEFEMMVKGILKQWEEATLEQRANLLKLSNLPNNFRTHSE